MIVSLDMTKMNKILWIDHENMTMCAEAGIIGQDLEKQVIFFDCLLLFSTLNLQPLNWLFYSCMRKEFVSVTSRTQWNSVRLVDGWQLEHPG